MANYRRGKHVVTEKQHRSSSSSSRSRNDNGGGFPAKIPMNNSLESFYFPPGFRFFPTDQELIYHYLAKKVHKQELPPNNFAEINIYDYHPDNIEKDCRHSGRTEVYCFTPRDRKYKGGERPSRKAKGGYWKASGAGLKVLLAGKVIGSKRSLVFYDGEPGSSVKSNWLMHEYRLATDSRSHVPAKIRYPDSMKLDDYVLCKIYKKRDGKKVKQSVRRGRLEAELQVDVETEAEVQVDVEAEAEVQVDVEAEAEVQVDVEAEAEVQVDVEAEAEVQVEVQAEVKDENNLPLENGMENLAEIFTDDCVNQNYGSFDPSFRNDGYQQFQFLHPSSNNNIFPDMITWLPQPQQPQPLPLQMSYNDPSLGFWQQDLGMNSPFLPKFGAPYNFETNNTYPTMIANIPDELSAALKNHVNPIRPASVEASTSYPLYGKGSGQLDAPSYTDPTQDITIGQQVNLCDILPYHFRQDGHDRDMQMNTDTSPQPMKRTRLMDQERNKDIY